MMNQSDEEDQYEFERYRSPLVPDDTSVDARSGTRLSLSSLTVHAPAAAEVILVDAIILNIRLKYDYSELVEFASELQRINENLRVENNPVSILHLYALKSTRDPVDMSNQTVRTIYRPTLFIQKNDAFGPWNFNYLLNLLELEYQCRSHDGNFPQVWKTTDVTQVTVNILSTTKTKTTTNPNTDAIEVDTTEESTTLFGVLKQVCRQNKCDETDANIWLRSLKEENITTLEHLRNVSTNDSWEKITALKHVPKQMICDYMKISAASQSFARETNPYEESKATLLGDIHKVRRYFAYVIGNLKEVSYLDRNAVNLAITEMRRTYDDDGNVLNNIHNYLRTFCLKNKVNTPDDHEKQRNKWREELDALNRTNKPRSEEVERCRNECKIAEENIMLYERRYKNLLCQEPEIQKEANDLIERARNMAMIHGNNNWTELHENAKRKQSDYKKDVKNAEIDLEKRRQFLQTKKKQCLDLETKLDYTMKHIQDLNEFLKLDLNDEHRKLNVKYGRGILLYGPPGTGKSELLKRAAIYAGITMITVPLAAGELNRPYVGQTEKLLIDIMDRAKTIDYLICAMTIDEIDGLVPKRDNNAQQSKVDGISVLLSHIEGVKNIPNLIVFGATNRRNMMDEAFLRRIQAKCFVGRPSPEIRKKMLRPLLVKDSRTFTSERIDYLAKITTNFSGAAVGALKSSIIVTMDNQSNLTNDNLLELADNAAREFSCWFGIGTFPEICLHYPNILNSRTEDDYSLSLPGTSPTGRILVDLQKRKCLIELNNEPTMEKDLNETETSVLPLLARFVHGCSSRNIDTIQIIDLNFLTKHNAFEENQIFELLTTTFLECDEYNRSMIIFDIDSLIMLSVSDSQMSKSLSISNIRLYQFIRQKCTAAIVKEKENDTNTNVNSVKEKWIVLIIKHPLLLSLLLEDIAFKKTSQQLKQEKEEEEKRIDDETARKCPKCLQNYIPSKTNYGNCHYHDGFVFDLDRNTRLTNDEAQCIMQKDKLVNRNSDQKPKLIWACCLGFYGVDQPCQTGLCGLPDELKDRLDINSSKQDPIVLVQQHFKNNQIAEQKIKKFVESYRQTTRNALLSNNSVADRSFDTHTNRK